MRLFIAIDLPDEQKRELGRLWTDIPGAHWLSAEQIHLTLAFLGEMNDLTAGRLTAQLARIQAAAFELSPARTGCFPNRHRPRVVWIGLKPESALLRLATIVHETVLACGIILEERPFSPHITLARLKLPASRELGAFLDRQSSVNLKPFSVTEFTLFQSRLTPQGAVHIPVRSFPLTVAGNNVER